jgi:hypothetical protein
MTSTPSTARLSYGDARSRFATHPIRLSEIPVEHAVSLPVATLRFGAPGYAWFAGPARRIPHQPLQLGAPDRCWALGADRPGLLAYALISAMPIMTEFSPEPVTLPAATRSIEAIEEDLQVIESLMDRASGLFFAAEPAPPALASDLLAVLTAHVTAGVIGWYRALAPDFFGWLTAAEQPQ